VEETKKLAREVKSLNKAVRNFEVYRLLEEALKAMLTSLPLVQVRGWACGDWGGSMTGGGMFRLRAASCVAVALDITCQTCPPSTATGPPPPGHARPPLEDADAGHRQAVCDGRPLLPG